MRLHFPTCAGARESAQRSSAGSLPATQGNPCSGDSRARSRIGKVGAPPTTMQVFPARGRGCWTISAGSAAKGIEPRLPNCSADRTARVEAEVEIGVHRLHQLRHFVREEVVGARDRLMLDRDVAL